MAWVSEVYCIIYFLSKLHIHNLQPSNSLGSTKCSIPMLTFSLFHFASNLHLHLQTSKRSGYLKFGIFVRTYPCYYWGSSVTSEVKRSMGVTALRSPAKMLFNWQKILVRNLCHIIIIVTVLVFHCYSETCMSIVSVPL